MIVFKRDISSLCSNNEAFLERMGGKLFLVGIFDPKEVTYCCEISPSFLVHELYFAPNQTISEEDQLELEDQEVDLSVEYIHCSTINALQQRNPMDFHTLKQNFESMDEAIEFCTANHFF